MIDERTLYKECLQNGVDLQYGKLSLSDLMNYQYSSVKNDRRYQVHCEDNKYPWSMIYDSIDSAINKFVEIKRRVRRVR